MPSGKWISGLSLALSAGMAIAQGTGSPAAMNNGPMELNVVVTAGDRGKPIAGLPQGNFTVLDNGAPQAIRSFRAVSGSAAPVKVLIVIDAVNVGYDRIAYERQEIEKFLRANDGRLAEPTALAVFSDTGTQIQPGYSTDGNALSQELDKQVIGLRDLRRSAGFYGAEERLDMSLKTLSQLVSRETSEPGRKFILWVSPGWPLLSGPGVQLSAKSQQGLFGEIVDFSNALRAANTTLYAVDPLGAGEGPGRTFYYQEFLKGVTKPSQVVPGDLGVQVLAEQSGGLFLSGNNDIGVLLRQCVDDASAYYEISYQPPPSEMPNQYHRIEVRIADGHLKARTRQGYYSQP
ncbi:MAG TPA: VWA domain-containing protein [Acidobacteriaceae bacterium]|nr:VWA domain-containing protein [Acidobacteriaceae bacterium]